MNELLEHIKRNFNNRIAIKEKRPDIYQLILPMYHEDGDMIDIFLEQQKDGTLRICDFGMTVMRLSYSYEIDTENKEAILQRIISENNLIEEEGNIFLITKPDTIYSDILHVAQVFMKIGSMRYFKREVVESLFYEMLDEIINKDLIDYNPHKKVLPLPERDDLEVDYELRLNGYPFYLFGVKDFARARLATISCLEFQKNNLKFRSLIVHEDFDKLPKKDRSRLTNVCDKQYTSLDDFKSKAREYFEREK